jgi:F0F1-type ATP synthase epsilon subunit
MMANVFRCSIQKPGQVIFSGFVRYVRMAALDGQQTLYSHHVALKTPLVQAPLFLKEDSQEENEEKMLLLWDGVAAFQENSLSIFTYNGYVVRKPHEVKYVHPQYDWPMPNFSWRGT